MTEGPQIMRPIFGPSDTPKTIAQKLNTFITSLGPFMQRLTEMLTGYREIRTITDGATTIDVSRGHKVYRTANSGGTTIAAISGGVEGMEIVVFIDDGNTTIDFTGTSLTGNGGADWSPADGDHMRCTFDGANWRCEIFDNT